MNVTILQELIPFEVINTIVLPTDNLFKPVSDTRKLSQQDELSFLAVTCNQLARFTADQTWWTGDPELGQLKPNETKWNVDSKKGELKDVVTSSFILANEDVLVALKTSYSFFSKDLELINDIPLDQVIDGLDCITQLKQCVHHENAGFIQMSKISDLKPIKAEDI